MERRGFTRTGGRSRSTQTSGRSWRANQSEGDGDVRWTNRHEMEDVQIVTERGRWHGHLAARTAPAITPWQEVAVNFIGPWSVILYGQELKFNSLTSIDTITNYPEIICINNKTSQHVSQQFENSWLAQYPRPQRSTMHIYDQGSEFFGHEFQTILDKYGIVHQPTTVKNPQANAICERLHQRVANASIHPLISSMHIHLRI